MRTGFDHEVVNPWREGGSRRARLVYTLKVVASFLLVPIFLTAMTLLMDLTLGQGQLLDEYLDVFVIVDGVGTVLSACMAVCFVEARFWHLRNDEAQARVVPAPPEVARAEATGAYRDPEPGVGLVP